MGKENIYLGSDGEKNKVQAKQKGLVANNNVNILLAAILGGLSAIGDLKGQNEVAIATPGQLTPSGSAGVLRTNVSTLTNVPIFDEIIVNYSKHKIKIEQAHQKLLSKRGEIGLIMQEKAEAYKKSGNMQAMADFLNFFEALKTNRLSLNPTEYDNEAYKRQKMVMDGLIGKEKTEIEATKKTIAAEMLVFSQEIRLSGKKMNIQRDAGNIQKVVDLMNVVDKLTKPETMDSGALSLDPLQELSKQQGVQLTGVTTEKPGTTRVIPQEPTGTNLIGNKLWPITNTAGLTLASPQGGEIKMLPNGSGLSIKAAANKGGSNYIRKKIDVKGGEVIDFTTFFVSKDDMTGLCMTVSLLDENGNIIKGTTTTKNLDSLDGNFQVEIPKEIETFDPKKPGKAIKVKPKGLYFDVIVMHSGNSDWTKSPTATLQGIHARKMK